MFERKARDYQWPIHKIVLRGEAGVWRLYQSLKNVPGGTDVLGK